MLAIEEKFFSTLKSSWGDKCVYIYNNIAHATAGAQTGWSHDTQNSQAKSGGGERGSNYVQGYGVHLYVQGCRYC